MGLINIVGIRQYLFLQYYYAFDCTYRIYTLHTRIEDVSCKNF